MPVVCPNAACDYYGKDDMMETDYSRGCVVCNECGYSPPTGGILEADETRYEEGATGGEVDDMIDRDEYGGLDPTGGDGPGGARAKKRKARDPRETDQKKLMRIIYDRFENVLAGKILTRAIHYAQNHIAMEYQKNMRHMAHPTLAGAAVSIACVVHKTPVQDHEFVEHLKDKNDLNEKQLRIGHLFDARTQLLENNPKMKEDYDEGQKTVTRDLCGLYASRLGENKGPVVDLMVVIVENYNELTSNFALSLSIKACIALIMIRTFPLLVTSINAVLTAKGKSGSNDLLPSVKTKEAGAFFLRVLNVTFEKQNGSDAKIKDALKGWNNNKPLVESVKNRFEAQLPAVVATTTVKTSTTTGGGEEELTTRQKRGREAEE